MNTSTDVLLSRHQPAPMVLVDVKTTGPDPREDRILEIGAVILRDWRTHKYWNELVRTDKPVPHTASRMTGIDDKLLRTSPCERQAIAWFAELVEDRVVASHGARQSRAFLTAAARRHAVELAPAGWACVRDLAERLEPGKDAPRYRLGALCDQYRVPAPRVRRALPDARAAAQVLRKLRLTGKHAGLLR